MARREPPAVWTTETLRVHMEQMLTELTARLEMQLTEKTLRDQQRFEAQEKALADALLAVEKSTQATFVAADRATTKAEMAADERFKAVNAFREQLNDLISTFMPRSEADNRIGSLAARMEAANTTASERMDRMNTEVDQLASRIDKTEGHTGGVDASWGYLLGAIGFLATMVTIVTGIIVLTR